MRRPLVATAAAAVLLLAACTRTVIEPGPVLSPALLGSPADVPGADPAPSPAGRARPPPVWAPPGTSQPRAQVSGPDRSGRAPGVAGVPHRPGPAGSLPRCGSR